MKKVFSLICMLAILSISFTGCGDDDDKPNVENLPIGVHMITAELSGDTDAYDVVCSFGGTTPTGLAKLYNEDGEYQGTSYTLTVLKKKNFSCQTDDKAYFLTSAFSVSCAEKGKKLTIKLVAYIDGKKVDELTKTFDSRNEEVTVHSLSFSTTAL